MAVYFQYGEKEIEHLKSADERLAAVIDQVGMMGKILAENVRLILLRSKAREASVSPCCFWHPEILMNQSAQFIFIRKIELIL